MLRSRRSLLIRSFFSPALFVLAASVAVHGAKPRAGEVAIKPWALFTPTGEKIECEPGTLYVPENHMGAGRAQSP